MRGASGVAGAMERTPRVFEKGGQGTESQGGGSEVTGAGLKVLSEM